MTPERDLLIRTFLCAHFRRWSDLVGEPSVARCSHTRFKRVARNWLGASPFPEACSPSICSIYGISCVLRAKYIVYDDKVRKY